MCMYLYWCLSIVIFVINEDFIRKGNILKKHHTLLSLLAAVEVEVEVEVMRGEMVAKVLVAAVLVCLEQVQVLQALVVATVVAMALSQVQMVHQPLRQLLFPPFLPLHHFPSFPLLFSHSLFPYISRVLWRVLLTVLVF